MGRVADATAPAPRRSDDAIAFATARNSNNGDGVVPPQPFQRVRSCPKWWWAQGGCAVDPASLLLPAGSIDFGCILLDAPAHEVVEVHAQEPSGTG